MKNFLFEVSGLTGSFSLEDRKEQCIKCSSSNVGGGCWTELNTALYGGDDGVIRTIDWLCLGTRWIGVYKYSMLPFRFGWNVGSQIGGRRKVQFARTSHQSGGG